MARQLPILENGEYCWSSIGVFSRGSPTCPTLEQVIHCQNCAVYTSAGRNLFDRVAPSGYAEEWTRALRQGKRAEEGESLSLLVFRIGSEWLALETTALRQVSELKKVHSLPHRTDEVLLGVVNIRGQIQLCCSLASLLGLPPSPGEAAGSLVYRRMIVAESASDRWVFAVDEVDGVRRFRPRHLRAKPVTVAKHHAHLTRS